MLYPHTLASPQLGFSRVARIRMVVVFPAPFGPMNPNTSPCSSFKVSRSRAYRSPYFLVRSRHSIIGGLVSCELPAAGRLHRQVHADVGVLLDDAVHRP